MFIRLVAALAFLFVASAAAHAQTIIWSAAGTICVPSSETVGHYETGIASVRHSGTDTDTLIFNCRIERFTTAITDWVLKLSYRDSTGTATTAGVGVKLYRMGLEEYTPEVLATLSSNASATTTNNTIHSTNSFGLTFDFDANAYFVRVTLTRAASNQTVVFHSVAIEEK